MSVRKATSRTALSPAERALRSKLTQLVSGQPFIRGTLLDRKRRCGNPRCHCAAGVGHPGLYLIVADGKQGRQRQLYIPREWHELVRQWVENHHQIKALLQEISEVHWAKIKSRRG